MPDQHPTDEEIIAEERRRYRRRIRLLAIFIAAMATLRLLSKAYSHHLLGPLGISPAAIVRYFPMLVAVFFLVVFWRNRPPKGAQDERILRKQIDDYMARWRWATLALLFAIAVLANATATLPAHLGEVTPAMASGQEIAFVLIALIYAGLAAFGFGFGIGSKYKSYRETLSDELTRALRARAVRAGYLSLMALLGAAYLVTVGGLVSAAVLLPWLLAAGVAVPMLYFLILDWRAGADHE